MKDLRKITDLREYTKNPRNTTKKGFERCIKQLRKFGQYKPLLINQDGIVLGGNTRFRAMQNLDFKEVWVTEVKTKNKQEMMEYILSDNDNFSYYDSDAFMNMLPELDVPELEDFSVNFKAPITFKQIIKMLDHEEPEQTQSETIKKEQIISNDNKRLEIIQKLVDGYKAYLEKLDYKDLINEDKYALWR